MALTTVQFLRDFQFWCDERSLESARLLTDDQYYVDQPISFGSIHKLLVHAMAAQWIWLNRFRGTSLKRLENHENYPTRESLESRWKTVHEELGRFIDRQTEQSLASVVAYQDTTGRNFAFPLNSLLLHVLDHGSYHRGQFNTMLKNVGGKPVGMGIRNYLESRATETINPQ